MVSGSDAPGYEFSSQAKPRKSTNAGHTPSRRGYSNRRSSPQPGLIREIRPSAQPNAMLHGLTSVHRLPTNATKNPMPTHHTTHTKVGEKLTPESWSPQIPAATTSASKATEASLTGTVRSLDWSSAPSRGLVRRLKRQRRPAPGVPLTNSPMRTKERATAAPAPVR